MKDDPKIIDLPRSQWWVTYRNPIPWLYRSRIPGYVAYAVTFLAVLTVSHYLQSRFSPPAPRSMPPGEYTWTPEAGLQPRR